MNILRNSTLLSAALALVLSACGGGAGTDGKDTKGKTTTAKKDVKVDTKKKADDKKVDDKKVDEKKADDMKAEPPDTAGDTPPDDKTAEAELTDDKVVAVAKAAKEIEAKPADTDTILQSHGMDREQFDAAMVTIAKDQWKSDLYIAAFTQAPTG